MVPDFSLVPRYSYSFHSEDAQENDAWMMNMPKQKEAKEKKKKEKKETKRKENKNA